MVGIELVSIYKPKSLSDALEFLDKNAPDVKPIAGGTELLLLIRDKKIKPPKYLLDLYPLKKQLSYVKVENGLVRIGALTTVHELSQSVLHRDKRFAGFVDVYDKFGTMALRFEATIGGNLNAATQYSDYITLMLVFDASVRLESVKGVRELKLSEFVLDKRKTALNPNELVTEVVFREPPLDSSSSFVKFDRREILIAGIVTEATYLHLEGDTIKDVRISFDMVAGRRIPARALKTEEFLRGKSFTNDLLEEAAEKVLPSEMSRVTDWWTTADYRLEMSKVSLKRGLKLAYERVKGVR
ncbi:FAD binding domain-containing protein [Thermogladius sp. KZ2Tp1]|uniref:FAD binding domain-containing protein n=1 Tax=Thermogladius sp. KZ2Tp1 TaxID=3136289 RepID=UPI003DA7CCD3